MPETDYVWLPRADLLHFEEIDRLVDVFLDLGVDRVRLTGGEPLLRKDLPSLVERLARKPRLRDLAMTSNGVLLPGVAADLRRAGLQRVTISLDTLRRDRFVSLTRADELDRVLAGIEAAVEVFGTLKIDTVVIRGVNDEEIVPLLEFAKARRAEIRFIEYMDVGGATRWSREQIVSRDEILAALSGQFGPITPVVEKNSAPADRYRLPDGTVFGIIASTTAPFCHDCDRARLTADGMFYLCLYAVGGHDLRGPLRAGESDLAIAERLRRIWVERSDRGAEARLAMRDRQPLIPADTLRRNPHLEMHTRGG
jgi:cyclic pyranopterin phosphate synthase